MKKPRLEAFIAPEKLKALSSPLDDMPAIQPLGARPSTPPPVTAKPVAKPTPSVTPPVHQPLPNDLVTRTVPAPTKPTFDIADYPTRTVTFPVTEDERFALDELKLELARAYDLHRATKENLLRCAIHSLVEDFRQHGADSFVVRRLSNKRRP